ncbi:MAG: DMT family transporter [Candidatus Bathyarchaeota archaeon]|nr:MAG: DMT family transporter [Candidatus Bathyarchaeota archaeon]
MKIHPQIFIVLNILGFGLWGFIGKIGMATVGKYRYLLLSYLTVTLMMSVLFYASNERGPGPSTEYLYPLIGGICTGMAVASYFNALENVPLSVVSSLSSLYPVITVILSVSFLNERLTGMQGLGIILALVSGFLLSR